MLAPSFTIPQELDNDPYFQGTLGRRDARRVCVAAHDGGRTEQRRGENPHLRRSLGLSLTGVTVVRVDTLRQGENTSVSALLTSGSDSVNAMLGPVTFLMSNSLMLAAGDVIDIAGATIVLAGKPSLIATEIKKGETKLVLRDKVTGAPAWLQGGGMLRKP